MALIRNALSKIIFQRNDFCFLCLKNIIRNRRTAEHIANVVLTDVASHAAAESLYEVINSLCGEEVLNKVSAEAVVCRQCKDLAINSYNFIKMCKQNIINLYNAIFSITDSIENTLDKLEYKTLLVTLDMNDFTSRHYYDDKRSVPNCTAAIKRFNQIINTRTKIEVDIEPHAATQNGTYVKVEPIYFVPVTTMLKRNKHQEGKQMLKYDFPTIPTLDLVLDRSNSQQYKCKECYKVYNTATRLRQHYFRVHQLRKVKCSKCTKKFISDDCLRRHFDDMHTSAVCSLCGKSFTNKYILRRHEQNHDMKVMCQQCGRVYSGERAYKQHLMDAVCQQQKRKTSKEGTYECDHCKKRFCTKQYLANHIKYLHGNAEGYKCKFCDKKYYAPSRLKTHLLKHTQEKNFKCQVCGNRFVTKTSLLYHTRLHTGEKPYKCEYCDQAFLSASRRIDHVRRHHLAPSLECDICHVKFKATNSLLKHRKRHFNPKSRLNRSQLLYKSDKKCD